MLSSWRFIQDIRTPSWPPALTCRWEPSNPGSGVDSPSSRNAWRPVPTDPDMNAAEYALGTLESDERIAFLEQLAASEAVQAEVERWQAYLAPLEELAERVPPE